MRAGVLQGADFAVGTGQGRVQVNVDVGAVLQADDARPIAVTLKKLREFGVVHAREQRGVGDLVAVQVQDRQHRAVGRRVQKLGAVPGTGRGAGLGLAVADQASHQQIRVVECGAKGRGERITQLAAFVDDARIGWRQVARKSIRPREGVQETFETGKIARHAREILGQCAFKVHIGQVGRRAVARPGNQQHAGVGVLDQAVQVLVDQVDARRRAPVTQQAPCSSGLA